jgi:hypothetical protein
MKKYILLFLIVLATGTKAQNKVTDSLESQPVKHYGISSVLVYGVIGMLIMAVVGVIVLIVHLRQKARVNSK